MKSTENHSKHSICALFNYQLTNFMSASFDGNINVKTTLRSEFPLKVDDIKQVDVACENVSHYKITLLLLVSNI